MKKRIYGMILALAIILSVAVPGFETKAATLGYVTSAQEIGCVAGKSVTIAWNAVVGAKGYEVAIAIDGQIIYKQDVGNKTQVTIPTTAVGKFITFGVIPYDDFSYGTAKYFRGATAPVAPKNIALYGWKNGTGELAVSFNGYDSSVADYRPDGYEIIFYNLKGKKIGKADVSGYNSSIKKTLKKAKNAGCKVKMRSYIEIANGKRAYSNFTKPKTFIPYAKITDLTGGTTKTVTWKGIKNAKSYTIYRTNNGGNSFKKVKTVSGSTRSATVSGCGGYGMSYGVRVVANVKVKGKKYKSSKQKIKNYTYNYLEYR
ncbi:MAG: hypothetical protein K6F55_02165 [Eubacterium sp.]|nr:hypothetical protein [Eubacterium sp.]